MNDKLPEQLIKQLSHKYKKKHGISSEHKHDLQAAKQAVNRFIDAHFPLDPDEIIMDEYNSSGIILSRYFVNLHIVQHARKLDKINKLNDHDHVARAKAKEMLHRKFIDSMYRKK